MCICACRGFEVTAGPGAGENLQGETAASEDQEGVGRRQDAGPFLCVWVCLCVRAHVV